MSALLVQNIQINIYMYIYICVCVCVCEYVDVFIIKFYLHVIKYYVQKMIINK